MPCGLKVDLSIIPTASLKFICTVAEVKINVRQQVCQESLWSRKKMIITIYPNHVFRYGRGRLAYKFDGGLSDTICKWISTAPSYIPRSVDSFLLKSAEEEKNKEIFKRL